MKKWIAALSLGAAAGAVLAQATPVGLWKTIDDDGKTEKSLVRITESDGALSGKIEKIFDPAKQNDSCTQCSDERKGKPLLGLTILRGAKADAAKSVWEGGDIVDPVDGKLYRARLKPIDGGKKLEMRAFLGVALFGRTQTWIRVE